MTDLVTVTEDRLILPTYPQPPSEELPMFARHRIHQRSSGNPYPNKVVMSVDRTHKADKAYTVLRLENRYLCIEILPELGGRIYSALDKTTGYDFFYKQHVIKPALIGMLGSWISGGCEFNWPCHHRPSTFMPTDYFISRDEDGSATVWLSEHEPLDRMKGMVGIRLRPGEAVFDTLIKVYNRTPVRRSFLWWENVAVPVNEQYKLVFPPDVHYTQFHYRKNVTSFPVASGVYNGIRMGEGVDISLHKNTRQPTSYFCGETKYHFFGGYDEGRRCGVVHAADRHTSIGKKMFTWAYGQLGRSWEKALTDTDGAYAELMASSYSGNQPDFAWLEAYEGKEFSQSWYPLGETGAPLCATRDAAIALCGRGIRLQATRTLEQAVVLINGQPHPVSLMPGQPMEIAFPDPVESLSLLDSNGECLLTYTQEVSGLHAMPDTLPDNPTLDSLITAQDCYLAGVHVEQYRDPAISPDAYYREALARDSRFAPALTALARCEYLRANDQAAYDLALRGYGALTVRNFHPESGESAYILGLAAEALSRDEEALDWYQKAAWNQDARSRAMTRIAAIDGRNQRYSAMNTHARQALLSSPGNAQAAVLSSLALLRLGDTSKANKQFEALLAADPANHLAYTVRYGTQGLYERLHSDPCQTGLDLAGDLRGMGETQLAYDVLDGLPEKSAMVGYTLWDLASSLGLSTPAYPSALATGAAYPSRLCELKVLTNALARRPGDAVAQDLLACELYHLAREQEAADLWQAAIRSNPAAYAPYRNLAVADFSSLGKPELSLPLLKQALQLHPHDQQLIWETAYLMMRLDTPPQEVVRFLERECDPAQVREDIIVEWARAFNLAEEHEQALSLLASRVFTPCEGGEHTVAEQYMFAHHALGRALYRQGQWQAALERFQKAQVLPDSLGAGLWHEVLLVPHRFFEALCLRRLGEEEKALAVFDSITLLAVDYFSNMHLPELPCWQAAVYRETGRPAMAQALTAAHVRTIRAARGSRDAGYFKTTPFFISYQETAAVLRGAYCDWQLAMARWAAGDQADATRLAAASLRGEPTNLYARLLHKEGKEVDHDYCG